MPFAKYTLPPAEAFYSINQSNEPNTTTPSSSAASAGSGKQEGGSAKRNSKGNLLKAMPSTVGFFSSEPTDISHAQ